MSAWYHFHGDFLEYFARYDKSYYVEHIDEHFSIIRAVKNDEIIGYQLTKLKSYVMSADLEHDPGYFGQFSC